MTRATAEYDVPNLETSGTITVWMAGVAMGISWKQEWVCYRQLTIRKSAKTISVYDPHFSHLGSYLDEGRYQLLNPSIGKDIRGMHKGDDCCRDAG